MMRCRDLKRIFWHVICYFINSIWILSVIFAQITYSICVIIKNPSSGEICKFAFWHFDRSEMH
jgi:hypothetical protein